MIHVAGAKYTPSELAMLYVADITRNQEKQDPSDMAALMRVVKRHVNTWKKVSFNTFDEYVTRVDVYLTKLFKPGRKEFNPPPWEKDIVIQKIKHPGSRTEYKQLVQQVKENMGVPTTGVLMGKSK